ncbi:unnamed protein product [Peniophora sp. CBMAI 1063]|nr:unnamed protein product [Peniophora sp. CBMAI 1063]
MNGDNEKGTVHANPMPRQAYPPRRQLANPGPLGLYAFAATTLILSLFNVGANNIKVPNAVVGMAIFYGGLVQLLAGMWEFACGNTFGATAFSSYGGFWLSFAAFYVPSSGIADAYSTAVDGGAQEEAAIGIYLMAWMTITFLFFLGALRKNIAFVALFFFLTLTFMCLGAAKLSGQTNLDIAGGALGIVTALIAFYTGTAELLGPDDLFQLPLGRFAPRARTA